MKNQNSQKLITQFFAQIDLTKDEATLVGSLVGQPEMTVMSAAKLSDINRTTTYRLLERLKQKGIVDEIVVEHRRVYRLVGAHKLKLLVKEKELQSKTLKDLLPSIQTLMGDINENRQPGTKVLFYRGAEGIRQMGWNVLKSEGDAVGFTFRMYEEIVGRDFIEDWHDEWVTKKRVFRDIYSDSYLESKQKLSLLYNPKFFQSRYVPGQILAINHQLDIYNDTVAIYNWYEGDVFGVEIHNPKVARMQRQLFEIVWKISKDIE